MVDIGLAVVGWLAIGWLPGFLALDAARPGVGFARTAALASLVAVGFTTAVAEALYVVGAPVRSYVVLPISVGAPALYWCFRSIGTVRRRVDDEPVRAFVSAPSHWTRTDRALVLLAVVIGLGVWWFAIRSPTAVLPNTDGSHHALFAERILRYGTLKPSVVLSGDVSTGTPTSAYYPLALHVVTAMIAGVTGVPVNTVLTAGVVLAAAVLLPVGVTILMKRICPTVPMAGPVAAAMAATLTWFPYGPITWGGVPTIIAMAQVPIAVEALLGHFGPRRLVSAATLALAGYGLFQEHNSELVTVVLYATLLVAARLRHMPRLERRELLVVWAIGLALLVALVAPQIHQLIGGAAEATSLSGNTISGAGGTPTPLTPGSSAHVLRLVFSPVLAILACVGIVVAAKRRLAPGWSWCLLATVVLFVGTVENVPVLHSLTIPWYRATIRLAYMLSYFEVTYAGIAVVVVLTALRTMVTRGTAGQVANAVSMSAALTVAFVVGVLELPASLQFARLGYRDSSLVGTDERSAFEWLANHAAPGERVLNQFNDGSGWMETLSRVSPVFATKPAETGWGDRWYLLAHAADLAADPQAQRAARTWRVRFVFVDDRHFDGTPPPILHAAALAQSAAYEQVWHRGHVTIFEIRVGY